MDGAEGGRDGGRGHSRSRVLSDGFPLCSIASVRTANPYQSLTVSTTLTDWGEGEGGALL